MSYDIELRNRATGETAKMRRPQYVRGATVSAIIDERTGQLVQSEQVAADINITYNYSHYYYEATDGDARFAHDEVSAYYADGTQGPVQTEYGIRGINGKTPTESIQMLMDMINRIKEKYKINGEWIDTERTKTVYYKDGIQVPDKYVFDAIIQQAYTETKEIKIIVNEGDTTNYWTATAANAIKPLQDMIVMATDNLTEDVVWSVE